MCNRKFTANNPATTGKKGRGSSGGRCIVGSETGVRRLLWASARRANQKNEQLCRRQLMNSCKGVEADVLEMVERKQLHVHYQVQLTQEIT